MCGFERREERRRLRSGSHLDILSFHRFPFHEGSANDGHCTRGDGDVEGLREGLVVGGDDAVEETRRDGIFELRGADGEDEACIEIWDYGAEVMDELVGEDVLADGNEEGATKSLGKHHDSCTDGNVGAGKRRLHGDEWLLHAETDASTEDELISDPFGMVSIGLESRKEAGANGHEDRAEEHERRIVSNRRDRATNDHRDDD